MNLSHTSESNSASPVPDILSRLEAFRERTGHSRQDFASALGLSYGAYTQALRRGQLRLEAVVAAATLYADELDLTWLLRGGTSDADAAEMLEQPDASTLPTSVAAQQRLLATNRQRLDDEAAQLVELEERRRSLQQRLAELQTEVQTVEQSRVRLLSARARDLRTFCVDALQGDSRLRLEVLVALGLAQPGLNPDTLGTADEDLLALLRKELGDAVVLQHQKLLAPPSRHREGYRAFLEGRQEALDAYLESLAQRERPSREALDALLRAFGVLRAHAVPFYLVDLRYRAEK